MGEMPPGQMKWSAVGFDQCPLEGFTKHTSPRVIIIEYAIHSGVKGHTRFHGTSRTAYLPETKEGIEVLTLLAEAFRRRLTFKVGTSITTGQSNVVVW
jgi:deltex-like protein